MDMEKEIKILNLDDILPNRFQPRIRFNETAILELAESIKEHGVIQPIVVRKIGDKYEIIAGERRYKASILAGKTTIPAIVTNLDDKNSAEIALIENVQRQDLTPIEEAISYKKILDMGYLSQSDLADRLGKSQSTIANKLRLLNLTDEVQEALLEQKISERHARVLLKLKDKDQINMLNRIIQEKMTVRKTDEEISKILSGKTDEQVDVEVLDIERLGEQQMNKEYNIPNNSIIENNNPNDLKNQSVISDNFGSNIPNFSQNTNLFGLQQQNTNKNENQTLSGTGMQQTNDMFKQYDFNNQAQNMAIPDFSEQGEFTVVPMNQSQNNDYTDDINKKYNIPNQEIIDRPSYNENPNNPGFMDVEKIEKEAKDISTVQSVPFNNQENLGQNFSQNQPKAKFFTMLGDDENNETNVNNDFFNKNNVQSNVQNENTFGFDLPSYNNTNTIQNENTIPQSNASNYNNDTSNGGFEFKIPGYNSFPQEKQQGYTSNNNESSENFNIPGYNSFNTNSQDSVFEMKNQQNDFKPLNVFNLNDDNNFESSNKNAFYNQAPMPFSNSKNIQEAINNIRQCTKELQSKGYQININEVDLENFYQVTIKIGK